MNIKLIHSIVLAAAMLVGCSAVLAASEPPKEEATIATKLIAAMANSDYQAFVSEGDASFKGLKKQQFEAAAAKLGPKLGTEHEVSYLGALRQRGYRVTLWKISFKDGSDDELATLSMKNGKVGGFFIR